MNLSVNKMNEKEWRPFADHAHLICFKESNRSLIEKIDFALLIINNDIDQPVSYITCKEFDSETVYWQHGGAMPGSIGIPAFRSYEAAIKWTREKYKRIFTLIENTNTRMLKMAMKVGFVIIGVKNISGSIMLEHLFDFNKEDLKCHGL